MSDSVKTTKNKSKPRICPFCLTDKGIKVYHVRLNDHLRTQHRLSAAEVRQTTSEAKAAKFRCKNPTSKRCYWRCTCVVAVIRRGQHLLSTVHGMTNGTEEYFAKYAAFVKVGVSTGLYQVCYKNYMASLVLCVAF
ncbi:hypothetical protein DPMN_045519 [Dreissena polymorpha]|uniref:Uncharacterized protein n=1 Tax=Dreissena polymorpha TaxID=45954 RepID=A0A9D4D6H7_DREPO|nr:hypothetical protein DPMN_045517 [Dreissena polymorpha]KAH3738876.1 hypothetical protein DPMN_045519 [Dreissena polymorpha]